jgi:hypothetical protein
MPDIRDEKTRLGQEGLSLTNVPPGTGRRLLFLAAVVTLVLSSGFPFVHHKKETADARLASTTRQDAMEEPRVGVVAVGPPSAMQYRPFILANFGSAICATACDFAYSIALPPVAEVVPASAPPPACFPLGEASFAMRT